MNDADVLAQMRVLLQTHGLQALLDVVPKAGSGWPEMPDDPVVDAPGPAPVNLNTLADAPPVAPLLPVLEAVQVENAKVLPEIDQTLAQVDLAIAHVGAVSLEPAPLQIPKVMDAMTEASGTVDKTLDAL